MSGHGHHGGEKVKKKEFKLPDPKLDISERSIAEYEYDADFQIFLEKNQTAREEIDSCKKSPGQLEFVYKKWWEFFQKKEALKKEFVALYKAEIFPVLKESKIFENDLKDLPQEIVKKIYDKIDAESVTEGGLDMIKKLMEDWYTIKKTENEITERRHKIKETYADYPGGKEWFEREVEQTNKWGEEYKKRIDSAAHAKAKGGFSGYLKYFSHKIFPGFHKSALEKEEEKKLLALNYGKNSKDIAKRVERIEKTANQLLKLENENISRHAQLKAYSHRLFEQFNFINEASDLIQAKLAGEIGKRRRDIDEIEKKDEEDEKKVPGFEREDSVELVMNFEDGLIEIFRYFKDKMSPREKNELKILQKKLEDFRSKIISGKDIVLTENEQDQLETLCINLESLKGKYDFLDPSGSAKKDKENPEKKDKNEKGKKGEKKEKTGDVSVFVAKARAKIQKDLKGVDKLTREQIFTKFFNGSENAANLPVWLTPEFEQEFKARAKDESFIKIASEYKGRFDEIWSALNINYNGSDKDASKVYLRLKGNDNEDYEKPEIIDSVAGKMVAKKFFTALWREKPDGSFEKSKRYDALIKTLDKFHKSYEVIKNFIEVPPVDSIKISPENQDVLADALKANLVLERFPKEVEKMFSESSKNAKFAEELRKRKEKIKNKSKLAAEIAEIHRAFDRNIFAPFSDIRDSKKYKPGMPDIAPVVPRTYKEYFEINKPKDENGKLKKDAYGNEILSEEAAIAVIMDEVKKLVQSETERLRGESLSNDNIKKFREGIKKVLENGGQDSEDLKNIKKKIVETLRDLEQDPELKFKIGLIERVIAEINK